MLEYFCIFAKGGALLWTFQLSQVLRGDPINDLVKNCLLEDRAGEKGWTYTPKHGAPYTLKWSMHNGLGLVFVVVYQKALTLLYIDELLESVKREFSKGYKDNQLQYEAFNSTFKQLLKECEERSEQLKKGLSQKANANGVKGTKSTVKPGDLYNAENEEDNETTSEPIQQNGQHTDDAKDRIFAGNIGQNSSQSYSTAFNAAALKKMQNKGAPGRAHGLKGKGGKAKSSPASSPSKGFDTGKKLRNWGGSLDASQLDASDDKPDANGVVEQLVDVGQSRIDLERDEDIQYSDSEEDYDLEENNKNTVQSMGAKQESAGLLGSFMSTIRTSIVGKQSLSKQDIVGALGLMKRKLMERNVAEPIAAKLCESVANNLEGQQLASFTGVSSAVRASFEDALTRILTPKRSIDVLGEVRAAQKKGNPYVIVFCGVNGVGKSTSLSKLAYWLKQNDVKVMIAGCDTFRSGAIEQLKTHCTRLNVPLFERGYEKDAANVASEAIKQAKRDKVDVLLIDTAGRMQDNEPLMRALSTLINRINPDLVLFVGEALVGNDAVDQLVKFNQRLADLAPTGISPHNIDGIVLTKFDAIDNKVGAAISMVYASGAPIMFVGVGQTYVDLTRLHVKSVVKSLLS
eukprot:TRINITY_DN11008_c0_g1_i1.p1 TRINITY_DN11008_c0_g1~~TRINITY_DN11008_c0_g1_i1.p1  ORF type:complete len:630 (+),score=87.38 TRINITY_DN11008_c0_g1_i1:175-2064(+)